MEYSELSKDLNIYEGALFSGDHVFRFTFCMDGNKIITNSGFINKLLKHNLIKQNQIAGNYFLFRDNGYYKALLLGINFGQFEIFKMGKPKITFIY